MEEGSLNEMLSEEIPAVPAALWRHSRCQEEGPKHNTENAALEYLDCSPVCATVLLSDIIYLFIIFVTVAANCSFFVFWLQFCILFCSYSYLHYSRVWVFLGCGLSEGAGRDRREQLFLFSEAACCPWHVAWCAEALETWLPPAPSWALSAQLENKMCSAPELSVSQLCHLGLAAVGCRVLR